MAWLTDVARVSRERRSSMRWARGTSGLCEWKYSNALLTTEQLGSQWGGCILYERWQGSKENFFACIEGQIIITQLNLVIITCELTPYCKEKDIREIPDTELYYNSYYAGENIFFMFVWLPGIPWAGRQGGWWPAGSGTLPPRTAPLYWRQAYCHLGMELRRLCYHHGPGSGYRLIQLWHRCGSCGPLGALWWVVLCCYLYSHLVIFLSHEVEKMARVEEAVTKTVSTVHSYPDTVFILVRFI